MENKEKWLATVQQDWYSLKDVPKELIDLNICLAALQQNGCAFKFIKIVQFFN